MTITKQKKTLRLTKSQSKPSDELALHLQAAKIPFERELQFAKHLGRRWRCDFKLDKNLVVEVEGGIYIFGRHNRPTGMIKDIEKYNMLTLLGYRLIRVTPQMIRNGEALEIIEKFLLTSE